MASLNTLRTRFGVVLSIIIAFALLAFILSLKTEMGFSGNDPKIGVIDGEKIRYSEYSEIYANLEAGNAASTSERADELAEAAWQALISKHVMLPGFERMGLTVTDAERQAMISGEQISPILASIFTDPQTGLYDTNAVAEFLSQAANDPQAQYMWSSLIEQTLRERETAKYATLVGRGIYANSLEVAEGVDAANKTFAGTAVCKRYTDVADSLVTVSADEIAAYYRSHREKFAQKPSRSLSYVLFEVAASDEDMAELEQKVRTVGEEFAVAENLSEFIRANRNGQISRNMLAADQMSEEESAALFAGEMYGPTLSNNEWRMSRVFDTRMVADSVGIRHIVLPYTAGAQADSLMQVAREGADFAALASQYSYYTETARVGGDAGVMPFSAFPEEFIDPLSNAKVGDIVKVATGEVIQLVQVYRMDKPVKHVRIASITYPVEASTKTRNAIHAEASQFSVDAGKSIASFNEAVTAGNYTARVATIQQGERAIRGLENSHEMSRWAYGAKQGNVSEIFTVGNDFAVAVLTDIDNATTASQKKVEEQIRSILMRDKKYDYIVNEMQGATLEEIAAGWGVEPLTFDNVRYGSFFARGLGFEPRVIGALTTTEQGIVSEPIKGNGGVYVYTVDSIVTEEQQSAEGEKVRAEAAAEQTFQQKLADALQEMAQIEDLRGEYL